MTGTSAWGSAWPESSPVGKLKGVSGAGSEGRRGGRRRSRRPDGPKRKAEQAGIVDRRPKNMVCKRTKQDGLPFFHDPDPFHGSSRVDTEWVPA